MSTAADTTVAPQLPDTLRLGPVHLDVANLDRSSAFYERVLGLQLHRRDDRAAVMGTADDELVVLNEALNAKPGGRHAGLYHFALLFDSRHELARATLRLARTGTRIEGASDHGVSEAIYLRDPDDNGIELYVDRPREQWPRPRTAGDRIEMYTIALDIRSLVAEAEGEEPQEQAASGLRTGHVHLHVADVNRALGFYRDVLGFEVMMNLGSAAFVSAGGYHHHLGFNVWLGSDVTARPPGTAGLRHWTIFLQRPDQVDDVRARVRAAGLPTEEHDGGGFLVRDPWQTAVVFTTPDA